MRGDESHGFFAEPERIRVLCLMGVCQGQKNTGMIVGILARIRDGSVDIECTCPATSTGSSTLHELDSMRDDIVGGSVPPAQLGDRKRIDLPRHCSHALLLGKRLAV